MTLTLKYRPKVLEDLIGQDTVVKTILGMLRRGSPAQTIMLQGPWGCGKTSAARLIARYLNCEAEREATDAPCGKCRSCRNLDEDYVELNAAESRGIETIRSVIDQSAYMPAGRYRVFVLDEAHQLTPQAVQALLKVTEEPPAATIFILCTTEPQRFPAALASRCLRLPIRQLSDEQVVQLLQRIAESEEMELPESALQSIAIAAAGHARDAVTVLDGVAHMMASADPGDLDELVMSVADRVIGDTPEGLAAEILLSCYLGRFTPVVMSADRCGDPVVLNDFLINLHEQTIRYRLSPKLRAPEYTSWYDRLDQSFKDKKLDHRALIDAHSILLATSATLREGGRHAHLNALLRMTLLFTVSGDK